jgi:chromatin segregation and condensation protein Rec8/ScpA/Scc1 (kleisin family)
VSTSPPRPTVATLELDLDVFSGPFDLLLTLVLREEVDLLELQLAEVVLAYLDHLEARGELDLETATEFIVLIAALLELKSRLMLGGEDEELLDLDVFSGPFDLLLTLVLREEVDLLELQLAEVVLAYLDHLEARGELDLETATEFIVLIAALLEQIGRAHV